MNKKYTLFCILMLSVQHAWGMENLRTPIITDNVTTGNVRTDSVIIAQNFNSFDQRNAERVRMKWHEKTADSLGQGCWHAVEQIPVMIAGILVNVGSQKLMQYLESGSAEDANFMRDVNDAGKQEMFRSLLKNQLDAVAEDEEALTKQIASCSNKTEKETLQKILEEKRKYRATLIKQYHQFAHQHADNILNFVNRYNQN